MQIKATSTANTILGKFFKYNKNKKEFADLFRSNGCSIIKEKKLNCNTTAILGYKNEYVSYANYSALISRNGKTEIKYSNMNRSPLPSSMKDFYIEKQKVDKEGNKEFYNRRTLISHNGEIIKNTEHKQITKNRDMFRTNTSEYNQLDLNRKNNIETIYVDKNTFDKIVKDNFGENANIVEVRETKQYNEVKLYLRDSSGKEFQTTCELKLCKLY